MPGAEVQQQRSLLVLSLGCNNMGRWFAPRGGVVAGVIELVVGVVVGTDQQQPESVRMRSRERLSRAGLRLQQWLHLRYVTIFLAIVNSSIA